MATGNNQIVLKPLTKQLINSTTHVKYPELVAN